jgi:ATP phosphoribosyltransferase regulatory subunit
MIFMTALAPTSPDQLAKDLAAQQKSIRQLQAQLDRFGYDLVDTPLVEQADLFLIKAGDAAISRLVSFELPGKRLCLRPEFTVPAARVYINHFQNRPGAVRLQFAGPILQYESLSHNQIRQQNAVGAELLNERGPAADAEIIALTGKMLRDAGVKAWRLIVGHSGLIDCFLNRYGLDRQMRRFVLEWLPALGEGSTGLQRACAALEARLDAMPEASFAPPDTLPDTEAAVQAMLQAAPQRGPTAGRTREEIMQRLLSKQQQTRQSQKALAALQDLWKMFQHAQNPAQLMDYIDDPPMRTVAQEILDTFALLNVYDVPTTNIVFDLSLMRNLDYYTGIVFEYRTPVEAGHKLLGGGGRYDELVRLLGAARDVPAVGFMIYVDHVMQARATGSRLPALPKEMHILVRAQAQAHTADLIAVAASLREAGITVTTDLLPASPGATHDHAPRYTHVLTLETPDVLLLRETTGGGAVSRFPRHDLSALRRALEQTL